MILEEFDSCKKAVINPEQVTKFVPNLPKVGVTCFSKTLLDSLVRKFDAVKIAEYNDANGHVPVYKVTHKGRDIALFMSKVGAAGCVGAIEDLFEMGLQKIVMFGTCGVLDKDVDDLAIIIPNRAVRDEGTSYHYAEASREIEVNKKYKKEFIELLNKHNYSYTEGKVWTTDAVYRETKEKVLKRKEEGCICVDMECSAMAALANFRKKEVFQFFYAADNLDGSEWNQRSLGSNDKLNEKEKIGLLAIDFASILDKK